MKQAQAVAVYILNRRVYKESSLILDLFTSEYGRVSIIANSALKSKQGWSAMLQVFQPLLVSWTGRSSLKTLVSVEAPSSALPLYGKKLFSAYYLNELLINLLPQEDTQCASSNYVTLFLSYAEALNGLIKASNIEIPLRLFEHALLTELGLFPDTSSDCAGNEIKANAFYFFIPQSGFLEEKSWQASQSQASMARGQEALRLSGQDIFNFATLCESHFSDTVFLSQAKRLMRLLIHELLGGKELKSKALFQSYQAFKG